MNDNGGQIVDNAVLLKELIKSQIKNIPSSRKLSYRDLTRIVRQINNSIFDDNSCCLWNGYVTNSKPDKNHKGAYVNFYFKKRKVALHRLLFENFKEPIDDDGYLKYTCENKGKCCNVNHMVKFSYSTNVTTLPKHTIKTSNKLHRNGNESDNEDCFTINFL